MENNSLMGAISLFIGVAILLSISLTILGNNTNDCTNISDYDATATVQTGWSGSCEASNSQTQSAFALVTIVLIVISAVVVLAVVKML